ncbi:hypothetical protein [Streptomyces sp. A1547]|nr:hypothetical protein [Streptomyces sp. A1547]
MELIDEAFLKLACCLITTAVYCPSPDQQPFMPEADSNRLIA